MPADGADRTVQRHGRALLDFDPDGGAVAPLLQNLFHFSDQIEGALVIHRDVGVPADAEARGTLDLFAREEQRQEHGDHVLQVHVGIGAGIRFGNGDKAGQVARQDKEHMPVMVGRRRIRGHVAKHGNLQGWHVRRAQRIHGHGRKHGMNVLEEVLIEGRALGGRELRRLQAADAAGPQIGDDLILKDGVLAGDETFGTLPDQVQLLLGRQARDVARAAAFLLHELQAAYAHHEKLVQIRRRDGQELRPLQHWQGLARRFLQHALIESQPRKLAVDEVGFGDGKGRGRHGSKRQPSQCPGFGASPSAFTPHCVTGAGVGKPGDGLVGVLEVNALAALKGVVKAR